MPTLSDLLKEIRPESDFACSQDFLVDGILDSFDMISLVVALEKAFCISIDGLDIVPENFKNISCIERLIASYKGQK